MAQNDRAHCPRCGGSLGAHTGSWFTSEEICLECSGDERLAPNFRAAQAADERAIGNGDYHFAGIGLSKEDKAFLHQCLQARRAGSDR